YQDEMSIIHQFLSFLLLPSLIVSTRDLCSVYDPFKVLPEHNKFQIGGSFPLHESDCTTLRPDVVEEIVAIQWALTHWNQNPVNNDAKLGLYAGDTCSRSREALSQSLRFLDSVGYHEPAECRTTNTGPKLLGLICPKDVSSSISLGSILSVSDLPVAAYSPLAAAAMQGMGVPNLLATTPTLDVFIDSLIRVLSSLRSNLVAIVEDKENPEMTHKVTTQLREADIHVAEILPTDHPLLTRALNDSDSTIIVSLLNKTMLFDTLSRPSINHIDKLWISIPIEGEALSTQQQTSILPDQSTLELISIQPRFIELPQFRDYFLRVLKNNYKSYALLTTYVEQVYGCKGDSCPTDRETLMAKYTQARTAEAVIRMTYAFAAVGKIIGGDEEKYAVCEHATSECTTLIMNELLNLDFVFGLSDPSELIGQHLRFFRSREGVILAEGMPIEAIRISNGGENIYKVLEYRTAKNPEVISSPMKPSDTRFRSICAPFRPFCGQCQTVVPVNSARHFLSVPQHYPLYLVALFDMHEGQSCNGMDNTDISLPMAFVHTVWTFKQRFPQLSVLQNLDLGALLVDTCSSGKQAVETVVRAESQCFRFSQAGRNITIVPGSVFGYVSSLKAQSGQSLRGFFSSGDANTAFVSIDSEQLRHSFSALPPSRTQIVALLRLLNHNQWSFVTVALAENDAESLGLFSHFERLAHESEVCIAEVLSIKNGEEMPKGGSTNVTLIFSPSRLAASFIESSSALIHVLIGDSHDFSIHTQKIFPGTISVQPKDIVYEDFKEWAASTTPLSLPEMWFWSYIEKKHECALSQSSKFVYGRMCSGDELIDIKNLGRMTRAGYLARGVERLLFSLDAVYRKLCPQQIGLCAEFYAKGRKIVAETLAKAKAEDEIEIFEWMGEEFIPIGNWTTRGGLRMAKMSRSSSTPIVSHCTPPLCKCFLDRDFFQRPLDDFSLVESSDVSTGSYIKRQPVGELIAYPSITDHLTKGIWRRQPHNLVLLLIVTFLLIVAISVLLLILIKIYHRVVKGNQSLGITLLIGIISLYSTSYFFIFDPTDIVCRLRATLHGLSYSISFGVMIAKATQLRNAETLGFANIIHISFWNYWLLLFFIVGVQIALAVRWFAEPFMASLTSNGDMMCSLGREEFVLANIYVVILLLLALFLNARNRNIKRNYKETKWLFFASVACTLVWVAWIVSYFIVPFQYKDATVVIALLSCGSILMAFLFFPKIYILLSYEPVVVEFKRDQDKLPAHLFEREETPPSLRRAISPTSSTNGSNGDQSVGESPSGSSVGNYSDDNGPIFTTIMRKKKARSSDSGKDRSPTHSEVFSPEPSVIRCQSSRSEESAHHLPMELRLG
ncbi:hypothetical protein PRIPAC_81638, partial [Pristionchus pacificus]